MAPSVLDWTSQAVATTPTTHALKKRNQAAAFPPSYPKVPDDVPTKTLEIDAGTPDHWVKRDERLIRLTGKHPVNAEAPLTALFDSGFITPTPLFFVRSHGAVPIVENKVIDEWTISVCGLVANPVVFSIAELKARFEVVTQPATLVCAGNRRKEQNVVTKGLGFNWGPGVVSTALFTGVYLSDVLEYVKPTTSADGRKPKHVVFEGIDKLPQGPYGTSQPIGRAKNKNKKMMICWAMNGMPLLPDHGFPVRLVVPGNVGGRSVKWLHKIEVSHEESQHYLHFYDNKVLPTEVSAIQARAEDHWWHDPKYIIHDVNVNSVIAHPAHDEVLMPGAGTYTAKGYAYSGGGKRITRIEISLDEGKTWLLCQIAYPEDAYREVAFDSATYGRLDLTETEESWCWCFWSYEVKTDVLAKAGSIQVRAMDEGLALQQRDMYWNASSMMNNWWFKVAVHAESNGKLRFEHPTVPGNGTEGWMHRMKDEGRDILGPVFTKEAPAPAAQPATKAEVIVMTNPNVTRKITLQELKAHDKPEEPWFVVNGEVYDGTGFLNDHPGGGDSITGVAGQDATEDFMAIHSTASRKQLADFHVGTLVKGKGPLSKPLPPLPTNGEFLVKNQWKKVTLTSIETASHDSRYYRFALERADQPLGLPTGQHVYCRLRHKGTGDLVQRAYTPVSDPDAFGYIDLLVKLYLPNQNYPEGGKMSGLFDSLQVGDTMEMKGPTGSFTWIGNGMANWKGVQRKVKNVAMICGGSGVTPILQVLRGIFQDKEDYETRVWLIDANRTEKDILCRDDLEAPLETSSDRYHLHYTLNMPPGVWQYSQGRININMLRQHLPPPDKDSLALICGPAGMISACKSDLTELGWDVPTQLVVF